MKKWLVICLIILVAGAFTACSNRQDEALVGSWIWEDNVSFVYTFNSDGTGERGDEDKQTFTWSTRRNNRLILDFGREYQNDDWIYTLDGYSLNLVRRGDESASYTYFMMEHNPDLVGTWIWEFDETYELVFRADGTGHRGFLPVADPFVWFTAGGRVLMNVLPGVDEHWDFTRAALELDGENREVLTIDNRQTPGLTYSYIRAQ